MLVGSSLSAGRSPLTWRHRNETVAESYTNGSACPARGPAFPAPLVTAGPAISGLSTWPGDQANGGDYSDRASQGGGGPGVAEGGAQARSHQRLECQDHRRSSRVQSRLRPTQCDESAAGGGGSKENDACCGGPRQQ